MAGSRPGVLTLLVALFGSGILGCHLYLILPSEQSSGIVTASLALVGLSGVYTLAAVVLGVRAVKVGRGVAARLLGGLATVIARALAIAWLSAYFGVGL